MKQEKYCCTINGIEYEMIVKKINGEINDLTEKISAELKKEIIQGYWNMK